MQNTVNFIKEKTNDFQPEIGIILGSLAEQNFTGSLMMSDGSLSIFATNPICAVFLVLSVISLLSPLYKGMLGKMFKN